VTADGLRRLDPEAQMSVAAARLRPGADGALAEIEQELGLALGLPSPSSEVLNIDRVRSTPFLVAGALALLVTLSLAHQLLTSARRRRRDLAVLRVLGAGGSWVTGALHWQVTVLAAAVAAVAVPLGVGGARLVYEPFIDRLGARTDLSVPYRWMALAVAGVVLLGNAMALVPARRTRLTRVASLLGPD
jgi:predicted lysophospholipase L1 biosynthesis ABC-type transport system permease subunit